jgi:pyrroline-5-carboxylate reductase
VIAQDSDCRALSNLAGSGLAIAAEFARLCVSANEGALSFVGREMLDAIMAETFSAVAALHAGGRSFEAIITETAVPGGMTEAAITMLRNDGRIVIEAMMQETFRRQAFLRTRNLHV